MRAPTLLLTVLLVSACEDRPPGPCATDLVTEVTFDLDPDGAANQVHPDVAFDGEAVWLVYNLPDVSGGFDTFARRIHCDGSFAGDRIAVTTGTGRNDVNPAVAIADGRAHVVWQADDNTGSNSLDIVYRSFDLDGAALVATETDLDTSREGFPPSDNAFAPDVAALPDGGMVITGVRGYDEQGFAQAFVQRLDPDGALAGDPLDGPIQFDFTHDHVSAATAGDGTVYVAWTRSSGDSAYVVHTALPAGATALSPSPPVQIAVDGSSMPSYAASGDRAYLAFGAGELGGDEAIHLVDGTAFDGAAGALVLGDPARSDHSPTVATAPGGGAIAWNRRISGGSNDVVAQSFTFDGTAFSAGTETPIPGGPASAFAPAITHVKDDVYFVVWSEGTSPGFHLKGRFMQLN